jgi:hypothetical protein
MLNQQCWLWGQDVKREDGNLLLMYGFNRVRPPEGRSGSSQYSLALSDQTFVRLWGFGLYFGNETGLFINRFEFNPRYARYKYVWQASERSTLPRSYDFQAFAKALRWIGHYENWVIENFGIAYREHCLLHWKSRPCPAGEISKNWMRLAEAIDITKGQPNRPHIDWVSSVTCSLRRNHTKKTRGW